MKARNEKGLVRQHQPFAEQSKTGSGNCGSGMRAAQAVPSMVGASSQRFSAKSTHCQAQRERILDALRRRPQTSYDLRRLGAYQCAARVKELRDKFGFIISTARVTLYDRDGFMHPGAALYTLVSEPGQPVPIKRGKP